MGWDMPLFHPGRIKEEYSYFSVTDLDLKDPMISPAYSPALLSKFPTSLLISGTRDIGLSTVVYTHAELVKAGAKSFLHVWEGAPHCSFAQPVVDPSVPETREAWNVIVKFFETYLGK
jgi:monoterpene epsilon-lactone hydrolase